MSENNQEHRGVYIQELVEGKPQMVFPFGYNAISMCTGTIEDEVNERSFLCLAPSAVFKSGEAEQSDVANYPVMLEFSSEYDIQSLMEHLSLLKKDVYSEPVSKNSLDIALNSFDESDLKTYPANTSDVIALPHGYKCTFTKEGSHGLFWAHIPNKDGLSSEKELLRGVTHWYYCPSFGEV